MKNSHGNKINSLNEFIAEFEDYTSFTREALKGLFEYYKNQESEFGQEEEINPKLIHREWS